MKPLLVVNPMSGGGKTRRAFPAMRAVVERRLGPVDVEETRHAGHASPIAFDAAKAGRELIVAVGGDGTFSEITDGVMRAGTHTRVGIIGQGTGGDFRKTLGIEHRLDAYLDALASGKDRAVDVGLARFTGHDGEPRERHFVNILSAGMGGLVDDYVARGSRLFGGKAAYFVASAKALVRSRPGTLRCEITSKAETRAETFESYMIAVCNGRYFGSGMHVAPMAKIDDGVLEVVSLDAPNKLAFAVSSNKIYEGKHLQNETTRHFSCQKIAIDLENEAARATFLLDVDGEPLGRLPLSIEVLPGALTVAAPSPAASKG